MGMAFFIASKSKDPNTQVGAYIVSKSNKPLGLGYNGPPSLIDDKEINWERPHKYPFIIHSEANAIDHSPRSKLKGATLYVTAMPCKGCMLDIVAAKIARVVYFQAKNIDPASILARKDDVNEAVKIAKAGKIKLEEFAGDLSWMKKHMSWMQELGIFGE